MFSLAITVCFVLLMSLIYIILSLQPKDRSKSVSLPPSPPRLPIVGHLHLLSKLPHRSLHKLSQKYGHIMKVDLGFVPNIVISSPELAELFLKTHDLKVSNRPKSEVSECTSLGSKGMLFSEYGTFLRDIRKLCSMHLLSDSKIEYFRPIRREEVNELMTNMKAAAGHGEVVNISDEVFQTVENITCRMLFGTANKGKFRVGFKPLVEGGLRLIEAFNLNDYLPFLKAFNFQGLTRRSREIIKIMDGMLDGIIDDHEQDFITHQEHQAEFITVMMSLMKAYKAQEKEVNRTNIKVVIMDLLGGTWETSATTVEWALKELVTHTEIMKKVQDELENVVGMERMVEEGDYAKLTYLEMVSGGPRILIQGSHLSFLESRGSTVQKNFNFVSYFMDPPLEMVVKEVMRLHPFVPLIPRESVEDVTANGFFIPKKSRLIINLWAIGRDPDVWSDNAEKFYPERFAHTDIDIRGHDFRLIPFGAGRRQCPGLELGLRTVQITLAQLLHCFNLKLPDGMAPGDVDMTEKFNGKANPLFVVPAFRLHL